MKQIVHVVGWRLNGATAEERRRQADAVVRAFESTRGLIPGVVALDVGANVNEATDALDVGVVMVFRNRQDLEAYQNHPAHLALKAVIGPLRSTRSHIDIERVPSDVCPTGEAT